MKKNDQRKKHSINAGGVLLFANFLLASVGFSAWAIAESVETGIKANADDIIDLNQYFSFPKDPTIFEYTSDGIARDNVIDPSTATQEGFIEIPFQLDVKTGKIGDHLNKDATSLTLKTILVDKNSGLDFFSACTVSQSKLALNSTGTFSDSDYAYSSTSNPSANKELTSTFELSPFAYVDKTKAFFSVKYQLSFATATFQSAYSSAGGSFRFSFKAGGVFDE